jgi:hypothetical protein
MTYSIDNYFAPKPGRWAHQGGPVTGLRCKTGASAFCLPVMGGR